MVGTHQHATFFIRRRQQRLQPGVARQQVVQPRAGDKVATQANHCSALGVIETQFVIEHRIGAEVVFAGQLIGDQRAEIGRFIAG